MERLSTKKEEKTMVFYVCHPCMCLEEALKAFLKCFGIESTNMKEEENSSTSLLKPYACASDSDPMVASEIYQYSSSSSNQKSSQEGVADPPASTISQTLNLSSMGRGGPRRTPPTPGPPPQHH
ncbi:hypothetical protein QL285_053650 [Trifolium repens]|nr:hypothetical protein QL285_053650 [Trifolium repens]